MRVLEIYKMNVVRDGSGNRVEDYTVKLKAESKRTIRVNAKKLLLMQASSQIVAGDGKQTLIMQNLDQVEIVEKESMIYAGFHEMREKVRYFLKRNKRLLLEIEEINRSLVEYEFREYLNMGESERRGFSLYFKERYPERSKQRFGCNIGYMFGAYQKEFEREDVPKENVIYEETIFRTKDCGYGYSYVYPIKLKHMKQEATYRAKAAVCTYFEMLLIA